MDKFQLQWLHLSHFNFELRAESNKQKNRLCALHLSWRYCGNDIDKRIADAHVRPDYFAMRIEFSLNDFHWIHLIVTKSKSGKIYRDAPCLAGEKIPNEAAKNKLLWLYGKRYLPKGSEEIILSITTTGNVSVARWGYSWSMYHFWILSWFSAFRKFSKIDLGKILLSF